MSLRSFVFFLTVIVLPPCLLVGAEIQPELNKIADATVWRVSNRTATLIKHDRGPAVQLDAKASDDMAWLMEHLRPACGPTEIAEWSARLEAHAPSDAASRDWLARRIAANGPGRTDIHTYMEHLNLDDYVSFGGIG